MLLLLLFLTLFAKHYVSFLSDIRQHRPPQTHNLQIHKSNFCFGRKTHWTLLLWTAKISWIPLLNDWNAIGAKTILCYDSIRNTSGPDRAVAPEEVITAFLLIGETHVVWRDGQISRCVTRTHDIENAKKLTISKNGVPSTNATYCRR